MFSIDILIPHFIFPLYYIKRKFDEKNERLKIRIRLFLILLSVVGFMLRVRMIQFAQTQRDIGLRFRVCR